MAWTAGVDVSTGDLISAAQWNNYLGVAGSIDYLKARVAFPGTQVYDAAAPAAFTDLDLSAVVGSNKALVFLKVKNTDGVDEAYYSFRTNGDSESIGYNFASPGGCTMAEVDTGNIVYIVVMTDASGIIEWDCDANQSDTQITVLAYIIV